MRGIDSAANSIFSLHTSAGSCHPESYSSVPDRLRDHESRDACLLPRLDRWSLDLVVAIRRNLG